MSRTKHLSFRVLFERLKRADALIDNWPACLGALKRRDDAAWSQVVTLCEPGLEAWLRQAGLQDADVQDIREGVFVAAWQSIDHFIGGNFTAFTAWLGEIAQRCLLRFWRGVQRSMKLRGDLEHLAKRVAEVFDGDAVQDDRASRLRQALEELRKKFRNSTWAAFWAVVIKGQPVDEVAEALHMTADAVRHSQWRILQALRKKRASIDLAIA